MFKLFSALASSTLLTLSVSAAPAWAGSLVTFVSGKGADRGNCESPERPCRTFRFALGQTSAGGEIKALDPANYGAVQINKSVSIEGVEGASINSSLGFGGESGVSIDAGPKDVVNISNLIININDEVGIVFASASSLTMTHCVVRNFGAGIALASQVQSTFFLRDVIITSNNGAGIMILPAAAGKVKGTLDHVSLDRNGDGLDDESVGMSVDVTSIDSTATNNSGLGFFVTGGAILRLYHSAATGNGTGIRVTTGGVAISAGNNFISGNAKDVDGSLTEVGTK